MDEAGWLSSTDPAAMLEFLRGKASDRKLRLFACAFCRDSLIWEHWLLDERSRKAVEVAERFVEGEATKRELDVARAAAWAPVRDPMVSAGEGSAFCTDYHINKTAWATAKDGRRAADAAIKGVRWRQETFQCNLLRDIFGPLPFHPVTLDPAWRTPDVLTLAQAAYNERTLPAGTLEPARLALLADALEDAGCANADLLGHLRGEGPHVRGCWAVDAILGKP